MFCPNCGKEIDNNTAFCGYCGASISTVPKVAKTAKRLTYEPKVKVKKVKTESRLPKFTKDDGILCCLWFALAALYIGVSCIFIFIFNISETITINSSFDSDFDAYLTLSEFVQLLLVGNRVFYPNIISTAIAVGMKILFYSVPVFAAIALISFIFTKRNAPFHIAFSVVSGISAILLTVVVPLSTKVIPNFYDAIAVNIGVLANDVGKIESIPFIIWGIVVFALIIVSTVVVMMLNTRRTKK